MTASAPCTSTQLAQSGSDLRCKRAQCAWACGSHGWHSALPSTPPPPQLPKPHLSPMADIIWRARPSFSATTSWTSSTNWNMIEANKNVGAKLPMRLGLLAEGWGNSTRETSHLHAAAGRRQLRYRRAELSHPGAARRWAALRYPLPLEAAAPPGRQQQQQQQQRAPSPQAGVAGEEARRLALHRNLERQLHIQDRVLVHAFEPLHTGVGLYCEAQFTSGRGVARGKRDRRQHLQREGGKGVCLVGRHQPGNF